MGDRHRGIAETRGWERRALASSRVPPGLFHSALFPLPFQDNKNSTLLNNYVLGAQLDHTHVNNLSEPVNISFWHNQSLVLLGNPVSTPPLPLCGASVLPNSNLWDHLDNN
jgi:hypothetical protein